MTKHKLRGLLNLERQGRHAERALLTYRAQEAEADRAYWFGVTDMRERLLAEQRDKLEKLARTIGEMAIAYDSQEQHYHAESARQAARINALIREQEKIREMFLDEQSRGDLMRKRITRAIEAINGPHDNCSDLAKKAKMADGCYVSRALIAVEKALTS